MNLHLKATFSILVIAMLPLYAFADGVAQDVGNGITQVTTGVGKGVGDVGQGVGDAVKDVGTGIGNAVTGNSSKPSTKPTSDDDLTLLAQSKINSLGNDGKIAPGYDLQASTTNGRVTISGTVINEADIRTVKRSVKEIKGVRSVTTNISIKNVGF